MDYKSLYELLYDHDVSVEDYVNAWVEASNEDRAILLDHLNRVKEGLI